MDGNIVLEKFTCDDCSQVFPGYKQFFLHREHHTSLLRSLITEEILLDGSCPLCFVKYYEKYKYECLEELLGSGRALKGCKPVAKVRRCKYYPKCKAEFYGSVELFKHSKEVHKDDKPYACQLCNYSTKHYRDLKVHLWNHAGYKMFKCKLCANEYSRNVSLRRHILSRHEKANVKSHDCSYCGKKFYGASKLRRHLKAHPSPSDCNYCNKKFCSSSELKRHLKIRHPTEAETKCHICSKTFSKNRSLKDHLQTHYKIFKCHRCAKEYARKQSLTQHLLQSHNEGNVKSHDCPHCGKKFIRRSELEVHLGRYHPTSETLEKSYECSDCNKKYFWRNELRRHIIRHHPTSETASASFTNIKSYDCSYCGKDFQATYHLKRHLITHFPTTEAKIGTECHVCSKKFTNLKAHLPVHFKMYKCHWCSKEYTKKESLTRHLLISHHDVNTKSHDCSYCDKKFIKRCSLEAHLVRIHPTSEHQKIG